MSRKILVRWKCDVCGKKVVISRDKVWTVHAMFIDRRPEGWYELYPASHQVGHECDKCAVWMSDWRQKQAKDVDPVKARRKHLGMNPDKEPDD